MAEHILIIEDDADINQLMFDALTRAGFSCTQAFSGTEALLLAERENYDLACLDLMLPGLPGEEVLGKLKEVGDFPVIVVSAKDSLDVKVDLLSAGADDYLTKPFEIEELVVRVKVLLRRHGPAGANGNANVLVHKDLKLWPDLFKVEVDGTEISLTKQEFKILELLMLNPERVFTKQAIYDYAWDDHYIGEDKTINVHISNMRKKLRKETDIEHIETVWGIGFKLKD